jgi:hypothetical protein
VAWELELGAVLVAVVARRLAGDDRLGACDVSSCRASWPQRFA